MQRFAGPFPGSARRRQSRQEGAMASPNQRDLGRVFNEVPELCYRVRPGYFDELFADLVTVTGMDERSSVLEVGCGSGQATRSLAELGCSVTAIEPGAEMAALARQRIATFRKVEVETSTFEEWDDRGGRFDVLVAASAWHWVDPSMVGSESTTCSFCRTPPPAHRSAPGQLKRLLPCWRVDSCPSYDRETQGWVWHPAAGRRRPTALL
ncbi:class I SAM-dependent methyltransferase [Streptomyces sp. NPDC057291]|uniref:class I SAM-dependent methyltransferase n=1 Tax=Streptomyces sp. NPDC057291 TaxID=3346087 RepID=UPI003641CBF1